MNRGRRPRFLCSDDLPPPSTNGIVASWTSNNKSRTTPPPCFRVSRLLTRRPVRIATVLGRSHGTIVGDAPFESSLTRPSSSCVPGSCDPSAAPAAEPSPTTHPFALPFQRYVKDAVLQRSADYLANEPRSYRHVARDGHRPITYESPACGADRTASVVPRGDGPATIDVRCLSPATIDERSLSPATIWRWVGWLGALRAALRTALELIRQKDPRSTLHRQVCAVPVHKYRTPARRTLLEHALRLLLAAAVFRRLFAEELFPRYATADDDG